MFNSILLSRVFPATREPPSFVYISVPTAWMEGGSLAQALCLCFSQYSIPIAQLTALILNRIIPVVHACVFVVVGLFFLFLVLIVKYQMSDQTHPMAKLTQKQKNAILLLCSTILFFKSLYHILLILVGFILFL